MSPHTLHLIPIHHSFPCSGIPLGVPSLSLIHPQPDYNSITSHSSEIPSDNEEALNLAEAINLMTEELKCCDNKNGKAKAKEPDTFNGSDPYKLTSSLLLCNLYFHNNSSYADDNAKVTFALTYLCGMALNFFEPALSRLDNWSAFVHILHTQFGPIDLTADAENSIDTLKMRDNQRILKYNIDFNRLAIQTGWSNNTILDWPNKSQMLWVIKENQKTSPK